MNWNLGKFYSFKSVKIDHIEKTKKQKTKESERERERKTYRERILNKKPILSPKGDINLFNNKVDRQDIGKINSNEHINDQPRSTRCMLYL